MACVAPPRVPPATAGVAELIPVPERELEETTGAESDYAGAGPFFVASPGQRSGDHGQAC